MVSILTIQKAEFLKQAASDSKNIVVGLVRDKAAAEKDLPAELKAQSNIYFLEADITNQPALKVRAQQNTALRPQLIHPT